MNKYYFLIYFNSFFLLYAVPPFVHDEDPYKQQKNFITQKYPKYFLTSFGLIADPRKRDMLLFTLQLRKPDYTFKQFYLHIFYNCAMGRVMQEVSECYCP